MNEIAMRPEIRSRRSVPAVVIKVLASAALCLLSVSQGAAIQGHPAPKLSKVVIGYYPSWARDSFGCERIEYASLTHISHAFTWPDSEGNLIVPDDYLYPELVETAHQNQVKMIMSIGGWGQAEGFAPMASQTATRTRFISQVVEFCRAHDYDGVDIDWEFVWGSDQQRDFALFIKEMSTALRGMNPPRLLTMAAPADDYFGQWINYEELAPYFDYIGFMTYDFHGSWSDHSGHNAPLYSCDGDECGSVDQTFNYALQRQVPLEKLLLGIPFYGRSFDSPGLYQSFQTTNDYAFSEIVDFWYQGWSYHWDDCAKVPYLLSPSGVGIISFDDPFSVLWKCAYVLDKQAAGVIIWELSQDGFQDQPLLIKIVGLAFLR